MSGIEGSGIVNPLDLGPHNPADQVTLNKLAIPAPHEVAPVTGERKPGEEPQRRDQRPAAPPPKRPTTTTSDRAADVPPGAQVLVALDEALVRQAESEKRWPAKFGQADKWKLCLKAAMMPRIRSIHDETSTTDP